MIAAVLLAAQVFTFIGHDCPAGYERLIPVPPKAPATVGGAALSERERFLTLPRIEPPEWKDIEIRRADGQVFELVLCTKKKEGKP